MDTKNVTLMERTPVPKAILTLSIPTLLSTIVSLLYNLTDTYFIGLLDDPIQLGAISLAFPVFMVSRTDFADIQNKKNVEVTDNGKDDF